MQTDIEKKYHPIIEKFSQKFSGADFDLILKAFDFAKKWHDGKKRESGEPYFYHCVATAENLLEIFPDPHVISAGLLHDVIEDENKHGQEMTVEELSKIFPPPIPELVEGVTKITDIKIQSARDKQIESFRKMFLAMAKDIRVVLIKMADRLHNIRTIKFLKPDKQIDFAKETIEIYAPLANRLGMSRFKDELEDRSMVVLYPKEYIEIQNELKKKGKHWKNIMDELKESLTKLLDKEGIKAEINGRLKHPYSIYRKMQKQGIKVNEIHDLIAMRIITETENDCYDIFGIVHGNYTPIPHRIKDFIAAPKENLYRSLHTTVILPSKERVEIQIRTKDMHKIAEEGIAAHWKYKEGKPSLTVDVDEKLKWLRTLREWLISETYSTSEFLEVLKQDFFADAVFCYTPKGDIFELPKGSTPVDFAYAIHSGVGEHCTGAKVNDKIVPLRYELNNGDIIEIITAKNAHPSANWLEFVKTSRAKSKIRHYIKSFYYDKNVEHGKEMLLHALKGKSIPLTQVQTLMRPHLSALKVNSFEELLASVGFGNTSVQQILNRINQELQKTDKDKKEDVTSAPNITPAPEQTKQKPASKGKTDILVDGMPNALIRIAMCCNPERGQPIVGFVTRGRGVSIHKKDCHSLSKLIDRKIAEDERLIKAEWNEGFTKDIQRVTIRIVSYDRIGLLRDVSNIITKHRLSISDISNKSNAKKSIATLRFSLLTQNAGGIKNVMDEIVKTVKGIIKVEEVQKGKSYSD